MEIRNGETTSLGKLQLFSMVECAMIVDGLWFIARRRNSINIHVFCCQTVQILKIWLEVAESLSRRTSLPRGEEGLGKIYTTFLSLHEREAAREV
jgi:hypothetical protein